MTKAASDRVLWAASAGLLVGSPVLLVAVLRDGRASLAAIELPDRDGGVRLARSTPSDVPLPVSHRAHPDSAGLDPDLPAPRRSTRVAVAPDLATLRRQRLEAWLAKASAEDVHHRLRTLSAHVSRVSVAELDARFARGAFELVGSESRYRDKSGRKVLIHQTRVLEPGGGPNRRATLPPEEYPDLYERLDELVLLRKLSAETGPLCLTE